MERRRLASSARERTPDRSPSAGPSLPRMPIQQLQRTLGNQGFGHLLRTITRESGAGAAVVQRNGDPLSALMNVSGAGQNLLGMLDIKDLVNLAEVNKDVSQIARRELYRSHAKTLAYGTNPPASEKLDEREFDQVLGRVRDAVNVGYRILMEILTGHLGEDFDPSRYDISEKRWQDFYKKVTAYSKWQSFLRTNPTPEQKNQYEVAHGKSMHPSTAAGYIVEDIAGHVLKTWFAIKDRGATAEEKARTGSPLEQHVLDLQDTEIMSGHSRPDVTSTSLEHNERMLLDITADSPESRGHILEKVKEGHEWETDWLRFPHVAEVLYPPPNFTDPNQVPPPLSAEDLLAVQERLLEKQIANDIVRYQRYMRRRKPYYADMDDRLGRARNAGRRKRQGKDNWKVARTERASLNTPEFKVEFTDEGVASKVTVQAFHTTAEGKMLLDSALFPPPSPAHYELHPDAAFTDWEFTGDSVEQATAKYMDLEEAAEHVTRKRKAEAEEREQARKKPRTEEKQS